MIAPKFKIIVKEGVVSFENEKRRSSFLSSLKDGEYEEVIRKPKKSRSNQQNAYLHGVILQIISEEIGDSIEEVKSAMKYKFLRHTTRAGLETIRDTSSLSTVEFEEFNENCRRWSAEFLNTYIPLPNECDYDVDMYAGNE